MFGASAFEERKCDPHEGCFDVMSDTEEDCRISSVDVFSFERCIVTLRALPRATECLKKDDTR